MRGLSEILGVIRRAVFSTLNKQFLIFLFFLFLSSGFWLMMTLNETTDMEIRVPVKITGLPEKVIITDDADTLTVTVRDKGYTLLAYKYGGRVHALSFRFADYADAKTGTGTIPNQDILKQLQNMLAVGTRVSKLSPDRLTFFFNYGMSKRVPIRYGGSLKLGASYYLAQMKFTPQMVTVYASQKVLDTLRCVYTEAIALNNVEDTIYTSVRLRKIQGVRCEPALVRLAIYPDVLTEESMEVPITTVNLPADRTLRLFPARVKVTFVVGSKLFRNIRPEDFLVVADYNDVADHPSDKCPLYIRRAPREVSNAKLELRQVDYLIEQHQP